MSIVDYEKVREILTQVSHGSEQFSHQDIVRMFNDHHFHPLVGKIDGEIVCYTGLHVWPHLSRGWCGHIELVVVDESARKNGYARQLCEAMIKTAKEHRCARIDLTTSNSHARKLYESLGFESRETTQMRLVL